MKKSLLLLLVIPMLSFAQFPQTFEGATFPPTGWTSFVGTNGLGTVENWKQQQFEGTNNTAVCVWEALTPGQTSQDWLVTPQVAITAANKNLTFQSIDSATNDYGSIYTVRVSTTSQTNIASFTIVDTQNETQIAHSQASMSVAGSSRTIDLTAYIGQSIYVAFVLEQNDGDLWRIDNVNFESCVNPVLTFASFTDNTAVVNFANAGNYQVQYGVFPYTQGGSGGTSVNVTNAATTTLTGLTPGVSYTVFSRRDCGSGSFSAWVSTVVGTSNSTVVVPPYSTSYEPATNQNFLFNLGWNNQATGNVGSWSLLGDGTTAPFYADNGTSFIGSIQNSLTTARDAYVFSMPITMTGGTQYQIKYKYRAFSNASTTSPMAFRVVTNTTNSSTGVNVLTTKTGVNNLVYTEETLQFTPSTTGNYLIGFHNNTPALTTGSTTSNYVLIDSFSVTSALSNESFSVNNFDIYPNPTSNVLNISNTNNIEINNISVSDLNGRVIKNVNGVTSVNVSDLNAGVYFVTIETTEGKSTKKFIKE
jgi:hypothetical protein